METIRFSNVMERSVRELHPGYFALVMATGIVSIAADDLGMKPVARILFLANVPLYAILIGLTAARILRYPRQIGLELASHRRGPAFLTAVAGTCILGSQVTVLRGNAQAGFLFWIFAAFLWLALIYVFFAAAIVRPVKSAFEEGLHGGWLVTVVSTQSLAVLGLLAAPAEQVFLFLALSFYLLGCALYLTLIALIFYRLLFFTLTPRDFTPPYWINMGAIAISTLAGCLLIQKAAAQPLLTEILPFLRGFTLFFWVTGTWWIPLLVILEIWRHLWKRYPLLYDPEYWDIVFPLGMYAAATFELARATGYAFLTAIASIMVYIALAAWLITFIGMARRILKGLLSRMAGAGPAGTGKTVSSHSPFPGGSS
jgi:tellurite resistance protein TehA-like permease